MKRPSRARTAAAAGLAVLVVTAIAGPSVAPSLAGFTPIEQHAATPFAPPGWRDVPESSVALASDPQAFERLDADGAGRLPCGPSACPALDGAGAALRSVSLVLADAWQVEGPEGALDRRVFETALGPRFAPVAAAVCTAGDGRCPLREVVEAVRFLALGADRLAAMDADGDGVVGRDEFAGTPATRSHLLGTDGLGRDVFVRLLEGLRMSLFVGVTAALAAGVIGVAWGSTAALMGGWRGAAMMRIVDVLYGLPYIFLVILLISMIGPSTANLLLAIACVQWLGLSRTVRGLVRSTLETPWIESARVLGVTGPRLVTRHVLPNIRRPVLAWTALLVPASIKEEAFLSFLGLGVQAPAASLGTLIADGAPRIGDHPLLVLAPAVVLCVAVFLVQVWCDEA